MKTIVTLVIDGEVPEGTVFSAFSPKGKNPLIEAHASGLLSEEEIKDRNASYLVSMVGVPMMHAIMNQVKENAA